MLITSAGIYGFLSNAYQKTANKLEIHEGELGVLDAKKSTFQKSIDDNQKIIDSKTKRLDQLSGLRTTQESRIDGSKSNRDKNSVRGDIASANTEIQKLSTEIDGLNTKNAVLSDSIGKYNVKALEKKSGSDVAGEVGPLKYISELTGIPMAKVVNYMILLLIFVFDPLAIALVLATNKAFELAGENTPLEPKKDSTKEVLEEILEELKHEHEGVNEGVSLKNDAVNEEIIPEEPAIEEPTELQPSNEMLTNNPIVSSGKIVLEDIKEVKEGRGYSVSVPHPKANNSVKRIGKI
jgi:predicted  nucleic acid-binding Zn-ribbon protein